MSTAHAVAAAIFWASSALVFFGYVGYPVVLWCLSRLLGRSAVPPELPDERLPSVSLLVAAYNEESVIAERVTNALATDYPQGKFDAVIASDGSKDGTADVVRHHPAFGDSRLKLHDFSMNRGKATVLNTVLPELSGDVVLLSDANTEIEPGALRKLVRWFQDPKVGVVCGRLVLTDATTGTNADGAYWKYETFLKKCEGRLGALLGSNGAIYAIRRDLYVPIPDGTIVDDFVIPLLAKQRTGCGIVYDSSAVAYEETAPDVRSEFHRRVRIGAGGLQAIALLWRLLNPARGWIAFTFFSHKILRWFCPFGLLGALVSSLALSDELFYRLALLAQLGFFTAAAVATWLPNLKLAKPLRIAAMFTSMNVALLFGLWRWMRGSQTGAWRRTARSAELNAAARQA